MHLMTMLFLASAMNGADAMPDTHALSLNVAEAADSVTVELIADPQANQTITYDIEVTGSSRSKHRGSTSIAAGAPATLTRVKVSHGGTWCALAHITEESGLEYTLEAGECDRPAE